MRAPWWVKLSALGLLMAILYIDLSVSQSSRFGSRTIFALEVALIIVTNLIGVQTVRLAKPVMTNDATHSKDARVLDSVRPDFQLLTSLSFFATATVNHHERYLRHEPYAVPPLPWRPSAGRGRQSLRISDCERARQTTVEPVSCVRLRRLEVSGRRADRFRRRHTS